MSILKIVLVLITGVALGIGVDQMLTADSTDETVNDYSYGAYCHDNEDFTLYMIESLNDDDRVLVETEIERILDALDTNSETVFDDFELRHEFMAQLMVFFDENDISFPRIRHHGMRFNNRYE